MEKKVKEKPKSAELYSKCQELVEAAYSRGMTGADAIKWAKRKVEKWVKSGILQTTA